MLKRVIQIIAGLLVLGLAHLIFYFTYFEANETNWLFGVAVAQFLYAIPLLGILSILSVISLIWRKRRVKAMDGLGYVAIGVMLGMGITLLVWPGLCGGGAGLSYDNVHGITRSQ